MRPSSLSLIHWMTPSPILPPHAVMEVRAPLFIPLLIISFNLKKQAWAAMSIPHFKTAIGTHTQFCLLLLGMRGGVEGDRLADKKRKREKGRA